MTDEWGLWYLGNAHCSPGWVDDCGDTGPCTRGWCEVALRGRTDGQHMYEIRPWRSTTTRERIGEWWEVHYARHSGSRAVAVYPTRDLARRHRTDLGRPARIVRVTRWLVPRGPR